MSEYCVKCTACLLISASK